MTSLRLDVSILPGCNTNENDKTCIPGEKLFRIQKCFKAGNGCYELDDFIVASLSGFVRVFKEDNNVS